MRASTDEIPPEHAPLDPAERRRAVILAGELFLLGGILLIGWAIAWLTVEIPIEGVIASMGLPLPRPVDLALKIPAGLVVFIPCVAGTIAIAGAAAARRRQLTRIFVGGFWAVALIGIAGCAASLFGIGWSVARLEEIAFWHPTPTPGLRAELARDVAGAVRAAFASSRRFTCEDGTEARWVIIEGAPGLDDADGPPPGSFEEARGRPGFILLPRTLVTTPRSATVVRYPSGRAPGDGVGESRAAVTGTAQWVLGPPRPELRAAGVVRDLGDEGLGWALVIHPPTSATPRPWDDDVYEVEVRIFRDFDDAAIGRTPMAATNLPHEVFTTLVRAR